MHTATGLPLRKLSFWKMVCIVFVLGAATSIASPAQTLTTLHNFAGPPNDGAAPSAGLVQGTDGNFYGTTTTGGADNKGTVFKITPSGTVTVLHSFAGPPNDGNGPTAGLIQASDGNFYGTTEFGGSNGTGTVFKITPSGTVTILYSFACTDGCSPRGGLIQASDGNFYGTTSNGTHATGTVFRITPSGTVTFLYSFHCTDGCYPLGGLVQGSDGNFYGTTSLGGASNKGTVFKITPNGTLTFLHTFQGSDGDGPYAGLIQASNGNFYGTTYVGGANDEGTVFEITPQGTLTTLHSFNGGDAAGPQAALVQASDGNFYGTTYLGGANDDGSVFEITPQGTLTTLHSFNGGDGSGLEAGLVQASDGTFYGTTFGGGSAHGTVFKLTPLTSTTTVLTSTPNPSEVGQLVTLTATVSPAGPTGTVDFTSNGTGISGCSAVPLSSGMAVCTTSTLALGTDAIVATYSGDSNYSGSSGTLSQIVNPVPSPVQFAALVPCRVVDTRNANGPFGGPPIGGHSFRSFPLSQSGNPCGIPASAVAYSLNVTVVPGPSLGYLTIWPAGEGQPVVSTMNSLDGRVKANAAIIPAGTPSGSVSVYVTDTTNVVLDIDGYFTPSTGSTLEFYPLTPCRVVDTRNANGDLGGPYLPGGQQRSFPVLESTCGIPNSAQAYSFNFTAIPRTRSLGFLTVWPEGQPQPLVSTLNDPTGTIVANGAIVPAGTSGGITVYPTDDTNLAIDVNGYFAPAGTGGLSLYVLTPCRVLDTRHAGGAFTGKLVIDVLNSVCEPPSSAKAYVFNATVVPQGSLGYLALWPDGQPQPVVSTLNATDGTITSNMAIVPASTQGKIDAYAANGITNLLMDISSYFAP